MLLGNRQRGGNKLEIGGRGDAVGEVGWVGCGMELHIGFSFVDWDDFKGIFVCVFVVQYMLDD